MSRKICDAVRHRDLVRLGPEASVREAARLMRSENVGSVLVMTGARLEGIFTERDLVCWVVAAELDPGETRVEEVMTRGPDSIGPDRPAIEGLRRMQDGGYRHLPVIAEGKVVAVVSRRDFFGDEKARLDEETGLWERI